MQHLEVSGAVRLIYRLLGVKGLKFFDGTGLILYTYQCAIEQRIKHFYSYPKRSAVIVTLNTWLHITGLVHWL